MVHILNSRILDPSKKHNTIKKNIEIFKNKSTWAESEMTENISFKSVNAQQLFQNKHFVK